MIQKLIDKFSAYPRLLFLIDAFGALLSAFLLGIILVKFEYIFGIPIPVLYFLASLPCFFAIYDFFCYFQIKKNPGIYLKIIAMVNIGYCLISLGLAIYHYQSLSFFGWAYILLEVFIVLFLATIELKTAQYLVKNN